MRNEIILSRVMAFISALLLAHVAIGDDRGTKLIGSMGCLAIIFFVLFCQKSEVEMPICSLSRFFSDRKDKPDDSNNDKYSVLEI